MKEAEMNARPRLASVAAALKDATCARLLSRLLDGCHHTARELAESADVTVSIASQHLELLIDERLARSRSQGRHQYFSLADAQIGHALEALMPIADGKSAKSARWLAPGVRALRHARSCYGHLAGEMGVQLCENFQKQGWVRQSSRLERSFELTATGAADLKDLDLPIRLEAGAKRRALLHGCVDWSERKDHFAGPLAVALLDAFLDRGWLQRSDSSRVLVLSEEGKNPEFGRMLGLAEY